MTQDSIPRSYFQQLVMVVDDGVHQHSGYHYHFVHCAMRPDASDAPAKQYDDDVIMTVNKLNYSQCHHDVNILHGFQHFLNFHSTLNANDVDDALQL